MYSTRSTAAAINGLAVNSASSKIPESASSAIAGASTATANGGFAGESNRSSANSQTIRGEGNTSAALANSLSKLAISSDSLVAQSDGSSSAASAAKSGKKSKFGRLHLAAPKLSRHASAADSATNLAPSFNELNGDAMPNDAADMNVLANKSNQPSAPIPLGGNVVPARLLSSVAPVYPQLARSQRLSGEVKIDALIGANGHVSATKVISGPALLQQAAMDAVRNWNYQPATLNGQPVSMHLTVTVQFKLQ